MYSNLSVWTKEQLGIISRKANGLDAMFYQVKEKNKVERHVSKNQIIKPFFLQNHSDSSARYDNSDSSDKRLFLYGL